MAKANGAGGAGPSGPMAADRAGRANTAGAPLARRGRPSLGNEELLDLALDLFQEHGFDGTSIEAITAAAGMAKRTLYQRFGDKESLFKAALQRAIDLWIVPVERLRALEGDDLEQTLLDIARVLTGNILSPAGLRLLRITNAEASRRPELSRYNYEHGTGPTLDYLADLFRRRIGGDHGREYNWKLVAAAFLNMVVSDPPTKMAWGLDIPRDGIERYTAFVVHIFLSGLLAGDAAGAAPARVVDAPESDRMRELEEENAKLRRLLVDALLGGAGGRAG